MIYEIKIDNPLLGSNTLLMKCISLMFINNDYGDILFQSTLTSTIIKAKTNNNMFEIGNISKKNYEKFLFNLKLALNLNFMNQNHIHQASFPAKIDNQILSFRLSIHPSYNGENISLRIIRPMYFMNSIPEDFQYNGLILIAGKTGSGKTTCYYSLLKNFHGNVISLEDPVEYPLHGVNQTNVSNCGYDEGIKSILRQVPDLIGIGEIRDEKSAKAVINAVLTGHTVITTIHCANISQVYERFLQFNIKQQLPIKSFIFMNNKIPQFLDYNSKFIAKTDELINNS